MSSVENVLSSDRAQHGGDAVAAPASQAIDGIRRDPPSPEAQRLAPEPRIPADTLADAEPENGAIEVPVVELRALAQKSRSGNRMRWMKRAVAVLALLTGVIGVGVAASWDSFRLSPSAWRSPFSTASSRSDVVAAAEKSSPGAAVGQAVRVASPLPQMVPAHIGVPANTELEQRIKALADSVALLQGSMDKLTAAQEQTARDIASLKDAEQELRRGFSALPPQPIPARKRAAKIAPPPLLDPLPPEQPPSSGPSPSVGPPPSAGTPQLDSRAEPIPRPPMPLRDQ